MRQILRLAVPAFAVLTAQPLYVLVDTAMVGHLGTVSLAGLAVAGTVLALATYPLWFLSYGTTARAARLYGANRRAEAVIEGVQASWLAVIAGVLLLLLGQVFAAPIAQALAGSNEVAEATVSWLRIALFGVPFLLLTLAGHGWLRGVQDATRPLRYVLIGNGVSAALCPILVYGTDLGMTGSAIANVTAQVICAALFIRALLSERVPLRPVPATLRAQLALGRDLVPRSLAFLACYASAATVAAHTSAAAAGAHQIVLQLWLFLMLTLDSLAIAAQSLIGAALGARCGPTARDLARRTIRYGLILGALLGTTCATLSSMLPTLFTSEASVLVEIPHAWWFLVALQPLGGIVFTLEGVLLGAGDATFLRNATIAAALGFLLLIWTAHTLDWGLVGVWASLTTYVLLRLIIMLPRLRSGHWAVLGAELTKTRASQPR